MHVISSIEVMSCVSAVNAHCQRSCFHNNIERRCRWDTDKDGLPSRKAILARLKKEGYQCSTGNFPLGSVIEDHSHPVDTKDAVISGRLLFRMDDQEVTLLPSTRATLQCCVSASLSSQRA